MLHGQGEVALRVRVGRSVRPEPLSFIDDGVDIFGELLLDGDAVFLAVVRFFRLARYPARDYGDIPHGFAGFSVGNRAGNGKASFGGRLGWDFRI